MPRARERGAIPVGEALAAGFAPLLVTAALLWLLACDDIDERLTDIFFDRATGTWPYKNSYFAKHVLHHRGRDLLFLVGASAAALAALGGRVAGLRRYRRAALFLALAIGLSAGAVAVWKHASWIPCPSDSTRYGGPIPHGSPFAARPPGVPLGQCFPGGHASGAFALMGWYYVLRTSRPRGAWLALGLGWLLGLGFGTVQVVRGAHFPSHNLWSALVAWLVCSALYWGPFRGRLWPAGDDLGGDPA